MQNSYTEHEYINIAKGLSVGGSTRGYCPKCCTDKKLWITRESKGYFCYCNKCSWKHFTKITISAKELFNIRQRDKKLLKDFTQGEAHLPDDFTLRIPEEAMFWLLKYSVSESIAMQYGIGYSPSMNRVILPVYNKGNLVFVQARAVRDGQVPKYISSESVHKSHLLFKSSLVTEDTLMKVKERPLVITEDILSAIVVGKSYPSISVMGTSISTYQLNYITSLGVPVVVWLDGDQAGIKGRRKMLKELELMGVECSYRSTQKDPKEYNQEEIRRIIDG